MCGHSQLRVGHFSRQLAHLNGVWSSRGTAMYVLYDTRRVHPLDRYEYARAGAGAELAPVAIRGRAPGQLLAVMSVAQVGDFAIEAVTWAADSEIVAHRTDRLVRACDPECYRVFLSINGGVRKIIQNPSSEPGGCSTPA
jgi:hypothetical protein